MKKKTPRSTRPEVAPREEAPVAYRFHVEERRALAVLWGELASSWKWLVAIAALGALLRFWHLGEPSLWMDEIIMLAECARGEYRTISFVGHKTHLIPVGAIVRALGEGPVALRLWSATLGTLAVPLLFAWGLWMRDRATAICVGLLTAVHPFLILYAQDGNYYGGVTFYCAAQMVALAIFLRGAPILSSVLFAIVSLVAFRNHPISVLATLGFSGAFLGAAVFVREVRRNVFAAPKEWKARPYLPLAAMVAIAVWVFAGAEIRRIVSNAGVTFSPGGTTLLDVEVSGGFVWNHVRDLLVNFHQPRAIDRWLAIVPAVAVIAGWLVFPRVGTREKVFLVFSLLLPIFCYVFIFSLQLNRNFNIRYFIFLVPVFVGVMSLGFSVWGLVFKRPFAFAALLAVPLLVEVGYTARYHWHDLSNIRSGVEVLASEYKEGERIIAPNRHEAIEARYYLQMVGLPHLPLEYTAFDHAGFADMHGAGFYAYMSGAEHTWISSSWRPQKAPTLYWKMAALPLRAQGIAKFGSVQDYLLYEWDLGDRIVYKNAAARIQLGESQPVLFEGPGKWQSTLLSPDVERPTRMANLPVGDYSFIPVLPDRLVYSYMDSINLPEHTKYFEVEVDGKNTLRSERDCTYDFLVYQPEGKPARQLVVNAWRRDESDPLLKKNPVEPMPGMFIAVSIDGIYRGMWYIESGKPERVRLPLDLELEPGNHRVSITGTIPRLVYAPYFPWNFDGIEWNAPSEQTGIKSLDAEGIFRIAPGWKTMPSTRQPGDWPIEGSYSGAVDFDVIAPGGDPSIRFEFPGDTVGFLKIQTPPMPVEPGSIVVYWFYARFEGLEQHEFTPVHVFLDSSGNEIPYVRHANGPNTGGSTFGGNWVRRLMVVPVPDGAVAMRGGFDLFPLNDKFTSGATLWVGSFASPGCSDGGFVDPDLPARYFGFAESDGE